MRKFFWFTCFVFLVAVSAKAQNDSVIFSAPGGFYEDVLQLELYNTKPQNHIRYTTNGNRPTAQSSLYEEALQLDENLYSKLLLSAKSKRALDDVFGKPINRR